MPAWNDCAQNDETLNLLVTDGQKKAVDKVIIKLELESLGEW